MSSNATVVNETDGGYRTLGPGAVINAKKSLARKQAHKNAVNN